MGMYTHTQVFTPKMSTSSRLEPRTVGLRLKALSPPHYVSRVLDQKGISQACYIVQVYYSGLEPSQYKCDRVPNQNSLSQSCYIVEPSQYKCDRVPNQNGISRSCYIVKPSQYKCDRVPNQNGISQSCYIVKPSQYKCDRVPNQNGISQSCYIVKIYPPGPEPSISTILLDMSTQTTKTLTTDYLQTPSIQNNTHHPGLVRNGVKHACKSSPHFDTNPKKKHFFFVSRNQRSKYLVNAPPLPQGEICTQGHQRVCLLAA